MEYAQRQRGSKEQKVRQRLLQYIGLGRTAVLLVLFFSLINQLLFWFRVDYHFLLSASAPYYLNWLSRMLDGMSGVFLLKLFAVLVTPLSFVAYGACWFFSAQRRHVIKTALLFYGIDTLFLVVFALGCIKNPLNCLLEFLVHVIGLAVLYQAHHCAQQLHRMSKKKRPRPASEQTESFG